MQTPKDVVVLSDSEGAQLLTERLTPKAGAVACYANVEDLIHGQSLASIAVLVVQAGPQPQGVLLATLGRMNVEYPAMQKVAVMKEAPSLPIARYMAACGVDLIWTGSQDESIDQLAAVVDRMYARTTWIVS